MAKARTWVLILLLFAIGPAILALYAWYANTSLPEVEARRSISKAIAAYILALLIVVISALFQWVKRKLRLTWKP